MRGVGGGGKGVADTHKQTQTDLGGDKKMLMQSDRQIKEKLLMSSCLDSKDLTCNSCRIAQLSASCQYLVSRTICMHGGSRSVGRRSRCRASAPNTGRRGRSAHPEVIRFNHFPFIRLSLPPTFTPSSTHILDMETTLTLDRVCLVLSYLSYFAQHDGT